MQILKIKLWGADSDSGTYEYFGEQVFCKNCFAGKDGYEAEGFDSVRGYQNSADDNQIVNGITGDENAIGYFGYAYYEENANTLSVAAIANNDTHGVQDAGGAVTPEASTVADGSYAPLSRYIYMNVNNDDWDLSAWIHCIRILRCWHGPRHGRGLCCTPSSNDRRDDCSNGLMRDT